MLHFHKRGSGWIEIWLSILLYREANPLPKPDLAWPVLASSLRGLTPFDIARWRDNGLGRMTLPTWDLRVTRFVTSLVCFPLATMQRWNAASVQKGNWGLMN